MKGEIKVMWLFFLSSINACSYLIHIWFYQKLEFLLGSQTALDLPTVRVLLEDKFQIELAGFIEV